MSIPGPLLERAQQAILGAYTRDELQVEVRVCLDVNLEEIVDNKSFKSQVHSLLLWADRRDCAQKLLDHLASQRKNKRTLAAVAAELRASTPAPDLQPGLSKVTSPAPPSNVEQAEAPDMPKEKTQRRTGYVGKVVVGVLFLILAIAAVRVFGDNLPELVGRQRSAPTPNLQSAAAGLEQPTSAPTPIQSIATSVVTALPLQKNLPRPRGRCLVPPLRHQVLPGSCSSPARFCLLPTIGPVQLPSLIRQFRLDTIRHGLRTLRSVMPI